MFCVYSMCYFYSNSKKLNVCIRFVKCRIGLLKSVYNVYLRYLCMYAYFFFILYKFGKMVGRSLSSDLESCVF